MAKVLVETSARHVHVTEKDLETLFGAGYQLTKKKDLSQPGQYACVERVDVVGPKKTLSGVSIRTVGSGTSSGGGLFSWLRRLLGM